jgi:hypothetical protein
MSHTDPSLYKNKTLSESVADTVKESIDELGLPESFKAEIDDIVSPSQKKQQDEPNKKGFVI